MRGKTFSDGPGGAAAAIQAGCAHNGRSADSCPFAERLSRKADMLGLPVWFWVIFAIAALPVLVVWLFYSRFRKMCRAVRQEIGQYLREQHPEFEVVGERQGNLVVRHKDGAERVWEMADVYAAVGRLPGMGADPAARRGIYARAVEQFLNPKPDRSQPLSLATHGDSIKLHLVTAEFLKQATHPSGIPHMPVPGLGGLLAVYLLDLADGLCYLSEKDRGLLGIDTAEMHRLALEHLRRDFPRQMVSDVLTGGNPSAIQFQDSLNATRLLLIPECLQQNEELIALIPHRDMLLLLPAAMRQEPGKLEQAVQTLECGNHPRLLDRPVRVTRDGFEVI